MVKLNARCSAILQNEFPPKEKDPGSFILPCTIDSTTVSNALAYLGASISIMPFSLFKQLGLGNPKPINMVIEMADRSIQSPKGIIENLLVDVFDKKIFLDVRSKQITFDINERESPTVISPVCVINNFSEINEFDKPRNLEELLMSDDINRDLGSFLKDNDLLPDLESQDTMSLSPPGSARLNDDSRGMSCNPNSNSSITLDNFVEMDDVWDNLDLRDLTNESTNSPVKPECLSIGNKIHINSPYNLQITCKIGFVNFDPYIKPQSLFNIMSQKAYNSIMKHELVYTRNNMVGFARNLHVFIEGHQFLIDFIILENINEFVEKGLRLTEVLFGQPFKEHVGIVEDRVKKVLWFKIEDDKTIFNMPRSEERFGLVNGARFKAMIRKELKDKGIAHDKT
ncbi:homeodomain-like protein [Tanacetum coccineum]